MATTQQKRLIAKMDKLNIRVESLYYDIQILSSVGRMIRHEMDKNLPAQDGNVSRKTIKTLIKKHQKERDWCNREIQRIHDELSFSY